MIGAVDTSIGIGIGLASAVGGILLGIVAWRKVGPERTQIVVSGTEKAFVIQAGVLDDVYAELERQKKETAEARAAREELAKRLSELERTTPSPDDLLELQRQNRELEIQLATVRSENAACKERIGELQQELTELRNGLASA